MVGSYNFQTPVNHVYLLYIQTVILYSLSSIGNLFFIFDNDSSSGDERTFGRDRFIIMRMHTCLS